ncbi:MAG: hypothetical protein AAB478_00125 [Patescibacteria group bacterium]
MATVPNLIAESHARRRDNPMTVAQAKQRLIDEKLAPRNVKVVNDPDEYPGVLWMSPPAGTTRPDWSDVDLDVNVRPTADLGEDDEFGVMPAVAGKMLDNTTRKLLEKRGFIVTDRTCKRIHDSMTPKGKITFQHPLAGVKVANPNEPGSWKIQVSDGPEPPDDEEHNEQPGTNRPGIVSRIWNGKIV